MRTNRLLIRKLLITIFLLTIYSPEIHASAATNEKKSAKYPKIHLHQASSDSAFVNSYIIETDKSLVLIDTLLTNSDYLALKKSIKSYNKPLQAVFITHPHPDHYNNIHSINDSFGDVPVYASSKTIESIRKNDNVLRNFWKGIYSNEYPEILKLPTHTIPTSKTFKIDDLSIEINEYDTAEADNQIIFYLEKTGDIILGDLISNSVHPYLDNADINGWREALESIKKRHPVIKKVYPGHGNPGDSQLINIQINYLRTLWDETKKRVHPDNEEEPLSQQSTAEIIEIMSKKFPYSAAYYLSMGMKRVLENVMKTLPVIKEEPFMY